MTLPTIMLYNTLTRSREPLRTGVPDAVTMYVCGPTVYNYAHIGNARPAVVFDVLARLLRRRYRSVLYARNLTDVDDKINEAARRDGVPIANVTAQYIDAYHADMQALGVLPPDIEPRVTAHIPEIIALVETLIERGHAYVAQGHVLFHVPSFPEYGRLSGRRTQEMMAGARVEVAPFKRDPLDFVLWKPSTDDLPGWASPWGRGRPGWHIECSAMIGRHLGRTVDIHGGGQDLIFPHHENEIAQGVCAHGGEPYCRMWMHNSFVTADGQKMSKSLGNVLLVRDLLAQAPGEAIRLALLSAHYRHPLDWSAQRLDAARRTLQRAYTALATASQVPDVEVEPDSEVEAALASDLNVPRAMVRLHQLVADLEKAADGPAQQGAKARLLASGQLLGLLQQAPAQAMDALRRHAGERHAPDDAWVESHVARRTEARRRRAFSEADALRDELVRAGIQIEDTLQGTVWYRSQGVPA
ncbi:MULTISPECIES: cysteine--tRNA ligase [Burkholderiaceae]|uniref:cysteine--tRNA ligase n=2 Tax=Burkholderiales TaxID=80840 RepID=UPI001423E79F|nr:MULTISPECIES: cysteine--tRNA ligase [Burkholderiaceae]MBN3846543.1 cysteine--tRNA ligase [Paraburkholderia sp. Ac-20342]NIF56621.1 cysteine--tRNA ligase [Burkholderia sp. Ax-1724]NIF77949.1 cysteine--tRNA ligase [Paraburkholderia sp. Cy-641]